jgi:hypothetical protein
MRGLASISLEPFGRVYYLVWPSAGNASPKNSSVLFFGVALKAK